jgi:hypothetical protein
VRQCLGLSAPARRASHADDRSFALSSLQLKLASTVSDRPADQVKGCPSPVNPVSLLVGRPRKERGSITWRRDPGASRGRRGRGVEIRAGTRVRHFAHAAKSLVYGLSIPRDTSATQDSSHLAPPRARPGRPWAALRSTTRLGDHTPSAVCFISVPPMSWSFPCICVMAAPIGRGLCNPTRETSLGLSGLKNNGAIGLWSKANAHAGGELHA